MLSKFFKKGKPKVIERQGKVTIDGVDAQKLEAYTPRCPLFTKEAEDWERGKRAVKDINIYTTAAGFECFLNQVILTGNIEGFIEHLNKVFNPKTNNYILQGRQISPCSVKRK